MIMVNVIKIDYVTLLQSDIKLSVEIFVEVYLYYSPMVLYILWCDWLVKLTALQHQYQDNANMYMIHDS